MMRWLDGITNSMDMSLSKLRVGDGQGGPACCTPQGHKESDTTEGLNNNNSNVSNSHTRGKGPLDEGERGERKSWLKAQHSEN